MVPPTTSSKLRMRLKPIGASINEAIGKAKVTEEVLTPMDSRELRKRLRHLQGYLEADYRKGTRVASVILKSLRRELKHDADAEARFSEFERSRLGYDPRLFPAPIDGSPDE
jgi:hypothetical protein